MADGFERQKGGNIGCGHAHLTCLVVVEGDGGDAIVVLVALRRVWKKNKVWESTRELGGVLTVWAG